MVVDEVRRADSLRVLVVGDDVSLRGALAQHLEREDGCTVMEAAHVGEVRRVLSRSRRPFDVALVDDLLASDADEEPEYLGIALLGEIRECWSEVEVVIFTDWGMERALEALQAGAYRCLEKPVHPDELSVTIRMAAEQTRLRRERDRLSAALEISQAMVSVAEEGGVREVIAEAIPRLTGADACAVALIDSLTGKIRYGPVVLLGDASVRWMRHLCRGLLTRQIIETGKPSSIANVDVHTDELDEKLCRSGVKSFIGVPIPVGARNLGVLYAYSLHPDAFGPLEERVLTLLARQAGIALENARLFDATQRAAEELSALNQVVLEIGKETDRTALLRKIIERAVALLAAAGGGVYLLDPMGERLTLAAAAGLPPDLEGLRIGKDEGLSEEILRTGEPQRVAEYHRSGKRLQVLDAHRLTGVAGAPIRVGGRILGTLIVHDIRPGRQFDDAALALLQQVADHAGLALEKAEVLEKQRTIQHVSTAIASSRDLSEVLNLTCQAAVELFGVDHSGLVLFDRDLEWGTVRGEYPDQPNTLGERILIKGVPAEERLAFDRQTVVFPDVEEAASELGDVLDVWRRFGIRSVLIVPIIYQERVLGSFSLDAVERVRQFTEEEVELCKVFAAHVAVAVENARLFSQLSETRERLDGLIASSLDAVIGIDQGKRITVFSRAAEEMCGWTAQEMIGQTVARLHADGARAREIFDAVNRDGAIYGWNVELRHRDGTPIPVLLSAARVRDRQGQPIGQAGFMRDLRETKLLEDRLRALIQVSQAITSTLELDEVLDLIVESAVAVFPAAQKGSIHLYDEETGLLHIRASHGYSPEVAQALTLKVGEGRAGWVYEHAAPLVVGNVHKDARSKKIDCRVDHPEVQEQKSAICVPLLVGDSVIGTVSLDNVTAFDAFDPEDLGLLSIFASQAAVAILNAELMAKNRGRVRKLRMLSRASNEMMSNLHSLSLDDRLSLTVRHAAQILDAEASSILLVKRPGFLAKEACYGHVESNFQKGREFAIKSGRKTGLTGHIAYIGELFNAHGDDLVGHRAVAGEPPRHLASGRCCSLLAIPLKRRLGNVEELVGLLEVENKKDADGQPKSHIGFTEEDEWILSIFAETVVICLENAELYERTSDRLEEKVISLKAIQETSAAISAELDLDDLLGSITEKAAEVFAAPAASLMLWDDREESLVVRAKHGLSDEYDQQRVPREKVGAAVASMTRLQPLSIVDLRSTPFGRLDLIEAENLCSVLSTPLEVSGKLIGVLNIYSKFEPRQFTSGEIEVAEVFASQAAIAIRNAQLYEEKTRRTNALEALYEAGKAVTSTLALDEILNRIVEQAWSLTAHRGKLARFSDLQLVEGNRLRSRAAYPPEHLVGHQERVGDIALERDERIGVTGRAAKTGQSQLVRDVTRDPDYIEYDPETRSELAVPIKLGEQVIGVINVEHQDHDAFDEDDQRGLESLAAQAAIAIQNARQFCLREGLLEAGEVVSAEGELYPALEVIAQSVKETIGCEVVCLYTFDEKRREISYPSVVVGRLRRPREQANWQLVSQERKLRIDLLGERSVIRKLLEYGSSRFAFCADDDPILGAGEFVAREGIESAAGILLKVGEEVVGILFANYRSAHYFSRQEEQAAELFAHQAAIAIRNAQLYEETTRRATASQALYEAGKAVTSTLALNEILNRIVEQAWIFTGHYGERAHFSHLALRAGNRLKFEAAYPPKHLLGLREVVGCIDLEHNDRIGVTGRAARTGQAQLVGDTMRDPDYISYDPDVRSELAVPIKLGEKVIGVINVEHPDCDAFDRDDQRDLESLAAQAAIAIQNARLYRQVTERLHESRALRQVATALAGTLELEEVLQIVMTAAMELTATDSGSIMFWDSRTRTFTRTLTTTGPDRILKSYRSHVRREGGIARTVIDELEPIVIPDTLKDYRVSSVVLEKGRRALIGVPLVSRGKAIGVLYVSSSEPCEFSERQVALLESLASQAAVVIERARQYEELKRTKGLVGARTALAWMGMTSSTWRHGIEKRALTIREQIQLLREDLRQVSSRDRHTQMDERLSMIWHLASQILEKPITPPLSAEEGVFSVSVNRLVRERTKQLWQGEPYRSVSLRLDLTLEDRATVRVSPEWLRRALDVLVDNAVDAVAGSPLQKINIVTRQKDRRAEILVSDTGVGIPEEILPTLFQKPIQRPRGAKGLGMGLLMAQAIVQTYGGEISVGSTNSTGTTMLIRLPVEA